MMLFRSLGLYAGLTALIGCTSASLTTADNAPSTENKKDPNSPLTNYTLTNNALFHRIASQPSKEGKDHAAILAMQGEYQVSFDFRETAILSENYQRYPKKEAGGYETVVVVEDTPEHIVLQHILVVGDGHVVKHWRQDWFYEAKERFEFSEEQTWAMRKIPEEKRSGHWTQCVYEVSDAPRYCGTGTWNHHYGVSTWTSDRSWRPLPRREYTVRNDYNALNVENRHTVTPIGWTHEQDNTKVIRQGEKTEKILVRESGFNDYRRVDGYDFSPAYAYWKATAPYWAQVRAMWTQRFDQDGRVAINTHVDGMPIIERTFAKADAIQHQGDAVPNATSIEKTLKAWLATDYSAPVTPTETATSNY